MLADWLLTAAPGFERGQEDNHELVAKLPRVTEVWQLFHSLVAKSLHMAKVGQNVTGGTVSITERAPIIVVVQHWPLTASRGVMPLLRRVVASYSKPCCKTLL